MLVLVANFSTFKNSYGVLWCKINCKRRFFWQRLQQVNALYNINSNSSRRARIHANQMIARKKLQQVE